MTMKRLLALLILCASASAQVTNITVVADSSRVIRTNFTLGRSQVSDLSGASFAISNITDLQTNLDSKLATNGSAQNLTNFPASVLLTNGSAANLTNFPSSVLLTNSSTNSFPAFLLRTNGSASGLTNFPTLNQNTTGTASNVTGIVSIGNGGTGTNTATGARSNLFGANGLSGTETFVAYDGTNFVTNTVVVTNGIITSWTP